MNSNASVVSNIIAALAASRGMEGKLPARLELEDAPLSRGGIVRFAAARAELAHQPAGKNSHESARQHRPIDSKLRESPESHCGIGRFDGRENQCATERS